MALEDEHDNSITEEMDQINLTDDTVPEVRNRRPSVKKLSSMDAAEIPKARRINPVPSRPREKCKQKTNKTKRSGAESINEKNSGTSMKKGKRRIQSNLRQQRFRDNQKIETQKQPVTNEFSSLSEPTQAISSHAPEDPITMDEEMPLSFCTIKRSASNNSITNESDVFSMESELLKSSVESDLPKVKAETNSPNVKTETNSTHVEAEMNLPNFNTVTSSPKVNFEMSSPKLNAENSPQRQGTPGSEDFSLHLSSESEIADSVNEDSGREEENYECNTNGSDPTSETLQLPVLKKHLERSDDVGEVYVIETIVLGKKTIVVGLNMRAGTSIDQIQNFIEFNLMAYSTKASMFNVVKNFQYDKCPMIMGGDFNIDFKTFRGRKFIAFLRNTFGVEMNYDPIIVMNRDDNDVDAIFTRNVHISSPIDNDYYALF